MNSSHVRELLAGALIKLAHRINPPTVTEVHVNVHDFAAARAGLTNWEAQQRAMHQATRWN